MTEEEMQVCIEAIETFGIVSPSYLMRKIKCDYEHADKLIRNFIRYTLEKDPINYRRLCDIIYEINDPEKQNVGYRTFSR